MANVVFATDEDHTELVQGDQDLQDELANLGHSVDIGVWNDSGVNWSNYDILLVRSTWDYEENYEAYLDWINEIDLSNVTVWNPPDVLRWNTNKSYLQDLNQAGIPIPSSVFIPGGSKSIPLEEIMKKKEWKEVVIKPLVGAGAYQLERYNQDQLSEGQEHLDELINDGGVLLQEYIPSVTEKGEWSFIFTGNSLSHTVKKLPDNGDYRVQKALGGKRIYEEPPKSYIRQANDYVKKITDPYLYLRLDGLIHEGQLLVLEAEMTEPRLYMEQSTNAAENLAEAVDTAIEDGLSVEFFQSAVPSEIGKSSAS